MSAPAAYPLSLRREVLPKVWGGMRLGPWLGLETPSDGPVGETWEVSAVPGQATTVADGELEGMDLGQVCREHTDWLMGRLPCDVDGSFPLLVKFLDTGRDLSLQVHPDDAAAAAMKGARPKTEAWYVLDADDDAELILGTAEDVDRAGLAAAVAAAEGGDPSTLDGVVVRHPVAAGDGFLVPAGTVHALLGGVSLVEVQQTSDTTFRLHDWGRMGLDGRPRALQVDEALDCVHYGAPLLGPVRPLMEPVGDNAQRGAVVRCRHFTLDHWAIDGSVQLTTARAPRVLIVVEGEGVLEAGDGEPRPLGPGTVLLLPAALGVHEIRSSTPLTALTCVPGPPV